jgi:ABC-type transporter Mla subunit MlaD
MWQEAGVVLIVAGALVFLARRLFGRYGPKKKKGTVTFVPLGQVKRGQGGSDCH